MKKQIAMTIATAAALGCVSRNFNPSDAGTKGEGGAVDIFDTTGPKLRFDEYEVLFTNPVCKEYRYDRPVTSNSGQRLLAKPKNAFCTSSDKAASVNRPESPQAKLISWIYDPTVTEVFFTYLSFSNSDVGEALCKNVETRNLKVTFVLDAGTENDMKEAHKLRDCKPANRNPEYEPRLVLGGHVPGILIAHNKVFLFNPREENMRIVFSSGNMTSGIATHHENWHFLRLPAKTYFAQSHLCLMEGELNHGKTGREFATFMRECRGRIGLQEESDIKAYFIPGDSDSGSGRDTKLGPAGRTLSYAISQANDIGVAVHRFSYFPMITALSDAARAGKRVRFVGDDDLWWAGHGNSELLNTKREFDNVRSIQRHGVQVKYMETNHGNRLLHHNKFVLLNMPNPDFSAVFAGAGNFTGSAFSDNWENFYYIRIPQVVQAFNKQYDHLFSLATAQENLPSKDILPPTE